MDFKLLLGPGMSSNGRTSPSSMDSMSFFLEKFSFRSSGVAAVFCDFQKTAATDLKCWVSERMFWRSLAVIFVEYIQLEFDSHPAGFKNTHRHRC